MEEQRLIPTEASKDSKACYVRFAESLATLLASVKEMGCQVIHSDSSSADEKYACLDVMRNTLAMYNVIIGQLKSPFDKDGALPADLQSILDECKKSKAEAETNVVQLQDYLIDCKVLRPAVTPKVFSDRECNLNVGPATNENLQLAKTAASQFLARYMHNFSEWEAVLNVDTPPNEKELATYLT